MKEDKNLSFKFNKKGKLEFEVEEDEIEEDQEDLSTWFKQLTNLNKYVKDRNIIVANMEDEVEELIKALLRYKKSNAILIGKPGVGKTALVQKLAILINEKKVPYELRNKVIYELSLNTTIAGTKFRGDFEQKVDTIFKAIEKDKNAIVFIDEIHNSVGLGAADGTAMALSETLKPILSKGNIQLIGATTLKEYEKYIKRDGAFDRRFTKITIKEPTKKETLNILLQVKKQYEEHYNIEIDDTDLMRVINRARNRAGNFPDKALDELEDYCYELKEEK